METENKNKEKIMRTYEAHRCGSKNQLIKCRDDLYKEYCFAQDFSNKVTSKEARKHYYSIKRELEKQIQDVELRLLKDFPEE